MIRHTQTTFGTGNEGDTREYGDCFAVAIACILEMPIEDVPNFCLYNNWFERTNQFLKSFDFCYLEVPYTLLGSSDNEWWLTQFSGYQILVGDGPRGCKHAIVGKAGKFVHDPHPSGDMLINIDWVGFFIPLEPVLPQGENL